MTNLLQNVKKDFKEFWRLPIVQDGVTYRKTAYDSVNASLLFERLAESSSNDDLAIVGPDDPTTTLLIIIEGLLSLLKYDMLNGSSQVLSSVKPGEAVGLMQDRKMVPGTYAGTEKVDGAVKYYCVKTDDGITYKIPPDRSRWRIQPYMAATAGGRKRSTVIFGKVLEDLIGLPPGGVMAFQRSKALLVTPTKAKITEAIRGVTLGGDSIETVFPMTDYADRETRRYIGSNSLHREPLLGLVVNTDTAVDIALDDPAIKLIIIDGASKVRSQYGSIERLNNDSEPRKIICLLKATDEDEIKTLSAMGIDVWVWKRQDFHTVDGRREDEDDSKNEPFNLHNQVLDYLSGPEPETVIVESQTALDTAVKQSIECVRTISRSVESDETAGLLLRWSISLINAMLQLPISLKEYRAYLEEIGNSEHLNIDKRLEAFQDKMRSSYGFAVPSGLKDTCEKLIGQLWEIHKILEVKNPKAEALNKLLEDYQNKPLTVICCKPDYSNALRRTINTGTGRVKVLSISEAGTTAEENVIVTGWFNRRSAARFFLAPYRNLTYLLYAREAQSYSRALSSHLSSPVSAVDSKLRGQQGLMVEDVAEPDTTPDTSKENSSDELDDLIDAVNQRFGGPTYNEHLQVYPGDEIVNARRLIFEDDSYAYIAGNHSIDKLERDSHTARKCKLEDIVPSDELIFAESERNMFEELLAIIQQSEGYKALFEEARLWHRTLENYMDENSLSERQLADQLALVGCKPGPITLKSWINGSLISPAESNLRALARVANNPELNDKLDDVMQACSKLYALHIQTGRLLVRRIIKAAVQEDEEELNAETRARIETYSQNAHVVTVREISDDITSVPVRATGKLFEA